MIFCGSTMSYCLCGILSINGIAMFCHKTRSRAWTRHNLPRHHGSALQTARDVPRPHFPRGPGSTFQHRLSNIFH